MNGSVDTAGIRNGRFGNLGGGGAGEHDAPMLVDAGELLDLSDRSEKSRKGPIAPQE